MFYPHHDGHSKVSPVLSDKVPQREKCHPKQSKPRPEQPLPIEKALCFHHCSARAAQSIKGHHRPVIASNFHPLEKESRIVPLRNVSAGARHTLVRPLASQQGSEVTSTYHVKVSFVIGINQTIHTTN